MSLCHWQIGLMVFVCAVNTVPGAVAGQIQKRPFTVADDIAFSHFGDVYSGETDAITFSPNERYVIVETERGLLAEDRSESTVRVFRTADIHAFALRPKESTKPIPIWILEKSTCKDGPGISHIHWLDDSHGFAFLLRTRAGNHQLFAADLATQRITTLTPAGQDVTIFDIRDYRNFVYGVLSAEIARQAAEEASAAAILGTGRSLSDLLFRADKYPYLMSQWHDFTDLWAVQDGVRFKVKDRKSAKSVHLYWEGLRTLSLSPDGRSVVVAQAVPKVPLEWAQSYLPPSPSSPYRIRAGTQDLTAFDGYEYVSQFVRIHLHSGRTVPLTGTPTGRSAGWWQASPVAWSPSGDQVALPNTFVRAKAEQQNKPCMAVVDLRIDSVQCLVQFEGEHAAGGGANYEHIRSVRFSAENRLLVRYTSNGSTEIKIGERGTDGNWRIGTSSVADKTRTFDLSIKQSFTMPPVLVVTDSASGNTRALLDPNPYLDRVELGEASIFNWQDQTGRTWLGGLYKPADFVVGKRYPLVIQTHGFSKNVFEPSGVYPTAFAARELAAAGMLVLQTPSCVARMTPEEASCNVAGYQAAVEKLVSQGLVDENRVGIVGFSRTCFHVLAALTSERIKFRAASITDGLDYGYYQYLNFGQDYHGGIMREANAIYGSPPFGEGLKKWLLNSPGFNSNKITAALQVVANGEPTLLEMWEPYASLRLQGKTVDLILLRNGTHVLTNPAERYASQTNTVDWFQFWLLDREDPAPAKASQYRRWRAMRKLSGKN